MWVLLKDFLLVSMGMGIGVVLMCILNVGNGPMSRKSTN